MNPPPEWAASLGDLLAEHFSTYEALSPLGCHICEADGVWEMTLFASRTEFQGGAQDGRQRAARFHLDLSGLLQHFDAIESAYWQALKLGEDDDLGPHIGIEGLYQGHRIWLRIPSQAPKQFPIGQRLLTNQQRLEDLW